MAKASTTTYLEIESVGADKLIATMQGLQKSMNFVAAMLKDLNRGLGISSQKAKEGAQAIDAQAKAASDAAAQATQLRIAMAAQMATTADLAKTVKALGEEQKKQSKSLDWQAVASKIQLARQAYQAVKGALMEVGQEALKVAQAWEVQEAAEMRLAAAIKDNPAKGQIEDYKQWASEIQNATKYGDEFVLNLASQAARMSKNENQTKKMTEAALNWADATGGDANQALLTINRAAQGNSQALAKLGIQLDENEAKRLKEAKSAEAMAFVLAKLEEQYAGFAEAMATTPTGALIQAQNILGDIDEQVGRLVSPAMYAGLSVVNDYLKGQLNDVLAITDDAEALRRVQKQILVGLATAAGVVIDLQTGVIVLKNSVEILGDAVLMTIGYPLKMLAPIFSGLAKIPGMSEEAKRSLTMLSNGLKATYEQSAAGLMDDIDDIEKRFKAADALKNQIWTSLEAADQKYVEASKKRQEAAGLGGGLGQGGKGGGLGGGDKKQKEEKIKTYEETLDAQLKAQLAYEQKIYETQELYAKKRASLAASWEIDEETKAAYKIQLTEQEEEAIRQIQIQYATETQNELFLLEDKYRQDKIKAEAAAQEELKAQNKATMQAFATNLTSVSNLGLDMFTGWIEGTGDWRSTLYDGMKSFSKNLMANALSSIINQALVNQAEAQGSQAGIPIVGPALALIAGAAMFATTMALKNKLKPAEVQYAQGGYISAGMVTGGAYGRDSVSALLAPGERVLSKKEAEAYDNGQGRGAQPINITINVSGQMATPAQVTDTVRRVLIPELRSAARAGYVF